MPEVLYESDGESWWSITDPEGIDDTTAQLGLIVVLVATASVVYWIWYVVSRRLGPSCRETLTMCRS